VPDPLLVAVVEDDDDERTALGRVLRVGGFDVASYASAEAFLASPPADPLCLVLDVQLDGMSGLDLLAVLRAEASTLPVVVSTARDDAEANREARRLGCLSFLRKPFSGLALVALLQNLAAHGPVPGPKPM
jgi:FixJ family two-component response regulator